MALVRYHRCPLLRVDLLGGIVLSLLPIIAVYHGRKATCVVKGTIDLVLAGWTSLSGLNLQCAGAVLLDRMLMLSLAQRLLLLLVG